MISAPLFVCKDMSVTSKYKGPVIHFGKHKGEALSDVEEDYLKWLASQDKFTFKGTIAGMPAPVAAQEELDRRSKGEKVIGLEMMDADPLSDSPDPQDYKRKPDKSRSVSPTKNAIDNGVDLLIKNYLIRTKKEQGFTDWLGDLAQEAIRYGSLEARKGGTHRYQYAHYVFYIAGSDKEWSSQRLVKVTKGDLL